MATESSHSQRGPTARFEIEIRCAAPGRHWRHTLWVDPGTTVSAILARCAVADAFPELAAYPAGFGLDGKAVGPETVVQPGQRIEVYRPLTFDPMVSRRRRAAHKARASR